MGAAASAQAFIESELSESATLLSNHAEALRNAAAADRAAHLTHRRAPTEWPGLNNVLKLTAGVEDDAKRAELQVAASSVAAGLMRMRRC